MSWWLWLILGLILLGVEVLTPGAFFFLFFGLGGILTALLASLGLANEFWSQGLWFTALSLASLVVFRGQLKQRLEKSTKPGYSELSGEMATLQTELAPGGTAKAEFRGTVWTAKSKATQTLLPGQSFRVDSIEGLTLWLAVEKQ